MHTEIGRELSQRLVPGKDELRAELDNGTFRERRGVDASADAVAGLEDDDLGASFSQRPGCCETGQAGTDDKDTVRHASPECRSDYLSAIRRTSEPP